MEVSQVSAAERTISGLCHSNHFAAGRAGLFLQRSPAHTAKTGIRRVGCAALGADPLPCRRFFAPGRTARGGWVAPLSGMFAPYRAGGTAVSLAGYQCFLFSPQGSGAFLFGPLTAASEHAARNRTANNGRAAFGAPQTALFGGSHFCFHNRFRRLHLRGLRCFHHRGCRLQDSFHRRRDRRRRCCFHRGLRFFHHRRCRLQDSFHRRRDQRRGCCFHRGRRLRDRFRLRCRRGCRGCRRYRGRRGYRLTEGGFPLPAYGRTF